MTGEHLSAETNGLKSTLQTTTLPSLSLAPLLSPAQYVVFAALRSLCQNTASRCVVGYKSLDQAPSLSQAKLSSCGPFGGILRGLRELGE